MCFEPGVLEKRNAKLLCSGLACVAEIRAVASAWSHIFDCFYSGPYFLIWGRFLKSLGV